MFRRLLRMISRWFARLNFSGISQSPVGREIETSPPTPINPDIRYEANDISWTKVLVAVAAITVVTIVLMFLLWVMLQRFSKFSSGVDYSAPSSALETPRTVFEGVTSTELDSIRRAENERLQKYAWVDREKGRVQIPLDRAMEMLVQKGPPKFPAHHHGTDHKQGSEHKQDTQSGQLQSGQPQHGEHGNHAH